MLIVNVEDPNVGILNIDHQHGSNTIGWVFDPGDDTVHRHIKCQLFFRLVGRPHTLNPDPNPLNPKP